jgi:hypothetical protein
MAEYYDMHGYTVGPVPEKEMADPYGNALQRWLMQQTGTDPRPGPAMPYSVSPVAAPVYPGQGPNLDALPPVYADEKVHHSGPDLSMRRRMQQPVGKGPNLDALPPQEEGTGLGALLSGGYEKFMQLYKANLLGTGETNRDRQERNDYPDPAVSAPATTPPPDSAAPAPGTPPVSAPDPGAPVDPNSPDNPHAMPGDDLSTFLDFVQKWFPKEGNDNARQAKADAYAAQAGERTRLLAQLAFAAGLTKAGGPMFEGIGQGLGAAAGVYGQGFDRYQRALQDSADRYQEHKDTLYKGDLSQREAALKLYTNAHEDARARAEKRYERLQSQLQTRTNEQYKAELKAADGDPAKTSDIMARWQKSGDQGIGWLPPIEQDISDSG